MNDLPFTGTIYSLNKENRLETLKMSQMLKEETKLDLIKEYLVRKLEEQYSKLNKDEDGFGDAIALSKAILLEDILEEFFYV